MDKKYAVIENDFTVSNTILLDLEKYPDFAKDKHLVDITEEPNAEIGGTFINGVFTKPSKTPDPLPVKSYFQAEQEAFSYLTSIGWTQGRLLLAVDKKSEMTPDILEKYNATVRAIASMYADAESNPSSFEANKTNYPIPYTPDQIFKATE